MAQGKESGLWDNFTIGQTAVALDRVEVTPAEGTVCVKGEGDQAQLDRVEREARLPDWYSSEMADGDLLAPE